MWFSWCSFVQSLVILPPVSCIFPNAFLNGIYWNNWAKYISHASVVTDLSKIQLKLISKHNDPSTLVWLQFLKSDCFYINNTCNHLLSTIQIAIIKQLSQHVKNLNCQYNEFSVILMIMAVQWTQFNKNVFNNFNLFSESYIAFKVERGCSEKLFAYEHLRL